ncbi:MAG: hypothetical protein QXV32_10035, partial [Conexivisphaerales archaeon]
EPNSIIVIFYARIRRKKGNKKAIVATSAKLPRSSSGFRRKRGQITVSGFDRKNRSKMKPRMDDQYTPPYQDKVK